LTPAIINIKKPKNNINAAVPKSSMITRAATTAITEQIGTNLFRNNLIWAPNLSQTAARKKTIIHFASSEG
jgi:hypothetical protein